MDSRTMFLQGRRVENNKSCEWMEMMSSSACSALVTDVNLRVQPHLTSVSHKNVQEIDTRSEYEGRRGPSVGI